MSTKGKITPMQAQYDAIKAEYQDCLLFYRMGDFYEMFGNDAVVGSKALDITLTKRGKSEYAQQMCGIPYHAADVYIAKLIEQGFKVAICEQVEDPKQAKGIVKREVIRVITPGTIIDSNLIKEDGANYISAIFQIGKNFGIAYADISTGDFFVAEAQGSNALARIGDELSAINPKECILPKTLNDEPYFSEHFWNPNSDVMITPLVDELFIRQNSEELLLTQFKTASLEALGLKEMPAATLAAAALLYVCHSTQKRDLTYINNMQVYNLDNYLILDANTRRNLEITNSLKTGKKQGSLFAVCDKTKTALGSRQLKKWLEKPLLNSQMVNLRLDGIEELLNSPLLSEKILNELKGIADLERLISRVVYGNASPRDLVALKSSMAKLPAIEVLLASLDANIFKQLYEQFDVLDDLYKLIDKTLKEEVPITLKDGEVIKEGYSAEVDQLRYISTQGKNVLLEIETAEREKTGIKSLKVSYNKVFGYFIEVTKNNLSQVPEEYIRKQTMVNCERFITQELKDWEGKILGASEKLVALEQEIFAELREKVSYQTSRIQKTAKAIALMDCLLGLSILASENGYVKPIVNDGDQLILEDARHPVVEVAIGRENYISNSTNMNGKDHTFALITGPNMSGKSTYMRQVALAVIMARIGSYVPAKVANIGKIDRIFTRVGASDDLAAGQSTFMVEMSETSNIIRNATKNSLIILDEIGRGTSTYDGLSIAWAVSEYILQPELGAKTLFATHYHELMDIAKSYPQVDNLSVAVMDKGNSVVFLRKIIQGGTDKSYGIHVAKLAGLPDEIINRANEILNQLENKDNKNKNSDNKNSNNKHPEITGSITTATAVKIAENPLLEEIKTMDLNSISPIEALLFLGKCQKDLNQ